MDPVLLQTQTIGPSPVLDEVAEWQRSWTCPSPRVWNIRLFKPNAFSTSTPCSRWFWMVAWDGFVVIPARIEWSRFLAFRALHQHWQAQLYAACLFTASGRLVVVSPPDGALLPEVQRATIVLDISELRHGCDDPSYLRLPDVAPLDLSLSPLLAPRSRIMPLEARFIVATGIATLVPNLVRTELAPVEVGSHHFLDYWLEHADDELPAAECCSDADCRRDTSGREVTNSGRIRKMYGRVLSETMMRFAIW